MMDINNKDKHALEPFDTTNCGGEMSKSSNLNSPEKTMNLNGNHSQKFFMMYSTENGDGTTTSVAFGGISKTNVPPQFRTKQPRNIVTNSTQSMFAGGQRYITKQS